MGRLILVTVGTSILDDGGKHASGDRERPGAAATTYINDSLAEAHPWDALVRPHSGAKGSMDTLDGKESALLRRYKPWVRTVREAWISAEIASLRKLAPTPEDRIILLASDTVRGVVAARCVAMLCAAEPRLLKPLRRCPDQAWDTTMATRLAERRGSLGPTLGPPLFEADLSIALVEGLTWDASLDSAEDASRQFKDTGCYFLARMVSTFICHRAPQNEVICNITGGLKSAIPYVILSASLYGRVRLAYLYEDSPHLLLLEIPRLVPPVEVEKCVGNGEPSPNVERHILAPYFDLDVAPPRLSALGEALRIALDCPGRES